MNENRMFFTKRRIIRIMIMLLLLILGGAYYYIDTKYKITKVEVEGNEHYSDEEIRNMVLKGGVTENSLFLSLKYKNKDISDIPFIESMTVEVVAPDSIQILVYEKALAGCVESLGNYIYFDREGIVVEISDERTEGIPQVMGLRIGSFALDEALPVEDETIFGQILNITQLLTTYEIHASKLYFDKSEHVTLYFDEARVTLGEAKELEEKLMLLKNILPSLEGKKGVLRLENYDENTKSVTFELES